MASYTFTQDLDQEFIIEKSRYDELIKKGYSREQIAKIRIPAIIREVVDNDQDVIIMTVHLLSGKKEIQKSDL